VESIFFDSLADFGTSIIGVREAAKEESEEARIKVWSNVAILRLLMAFLSLGLGIILIYSWPDLKAIRTETLLAWSMMVFTSLAGSLAVVWQTKIKMGIKVIVEVLFPTVFLLCLWRYKGEISLIWVFGTYLIARIITLVGGWWMARGTIDFKKFNWKLIKKYLILSWPMGVYLLIFSAYDRAVDSTMIRHFFGPDEVAWYGLAYKIYGTLIQPAYFLVIGIFPILSSKEDNRKLFNISALVLFLSGIAMMLGVWIFAPLMIHILAGSQFEASIPVLRVLMVALVFAYIGHLVGFTLISREGQRAMLGMGALALVFNFVGNWVLIPRLGIMGGAIITVLTEALSLILMSWKLKQIWK
jgi:O-antigen/teichoic acid export membrane protein